MKVVYLKNYRKGFATNSSSTHSVIYRNKGEVFNDLNIFELDFYDRYTQTIAASKEAKIKYVAANIRYNDKLYEIMSKYYPQMEEYKKLIKEDKENIYTYDESFGMYSRGELSFSNSDVIEASIDYLCDLIEDEDKIIIGGSDELDFVYDTIEGHKELPTPGEVYGSRGFKNGVVIKNGNYWVGYGLDGKIRFTTKNEECIPSYPELVDLRITNKCQWNCDFCFMNSSMKEKEADFKNLENIIKMLSSDERYGWYRKRIEFSVGGGNILLYPHLEELFFLMHENGHIINTTINAKDCKQLINDEKLFETFKRYVTAIGISVTSDEDIENAGKLYKAFADNKIYGKQLTVHLIPELLGVDRTREIIEKLKKCNLYSILFLGYKTNGRGINHTCPKFTDEELTKLFNGLCCLSIDTTFAKTYEKWLKGHFDTKYTMTALEGEYSMYIDAVECNAYKSSYELDKPYPLIRKGNITDCYTPINAFRQIRKDNNLKVIKDENNL